MDVDLFTCCYLLQGDGEQAQVSWSDGPIVHVQLDLVDYLL